MTELRSKKAKKVSFQTIKMAEKISKIVEKLLDTEGNIVQDIHELVVELKQTVLKLEDIALKVQEKAVRETNDSDSEIHKKPNDQLKDSEKFVICDTCGEKIQIYLQPKEQQKDGT